MRNKIFSILLLVLLSNILSLQQTPLRPDDLEMDLATDMDYDRDMSYDRDMDMNMDMDRRNETLIHATENLQNQKWGKMQKQYFQQMHEKEKEPFVQSQEQVQQLQQIKSYRYQQIQKLVQSAKQVSQSQTSPDQRFASFLTLERSFLEMDDPKRFFEDTPFTSNINSIPMMGNVTYTGWSGSYWPMRNGEISVRYQHNDKNSIGIFDSEVDGFTTLFNWAESVSRYAQPAEHDTYSKLTDYEQYVDDNYSPSEKYDLLVGDLNFTLTNYLKNEGAQFANNGDVIGWFGICHGWAPASSYYPKPNTSVRLSSTTGLSIRFLPDDIKGLASLFWANAEYTTKFIGNRCEYYWPDPGWFSSPNCNSLNAASFLTLIGNQVGLMGKNMVFDPNADPEIWNLPFKSYEIRYYNPITNQFFGDAASARVLMDSVKNTHDEFLQYVASSCSAEAVYAIGVFMRITYSDMIDITELHHNDTTAENKEKTDEFDSIIELDASENMIGGEWKFKTHPNFAWWFNENEPVKGVSDDEIPFWAGDANFFTTPSVNEAIVNASSRGQPLKAIVDLLTASA